MGEPDDNESSEKLISVDELENQVILLPWYTSETDEGATLDPVYNGMNRLDSHVILLPWYPTEKKDIVESYLDYDGINDLGTNTGLLPLKSSQTNFRETSKSVYAEASTSGSPWANSISRFVGMGFPENIVKKTLEENGVNNAELVLEILLSHSALDRSSSESEEISCDFNYLSETDSCLENEDTKHLLDKERKLFHLIDMGFPVDEASSAVDAADPDTSIADLMDYIYANQTSKSFGAPLQEHPQPIFYDDDEIAVIKKRKFAEEEIRKRKVRTWQSPEEAFRQKLKKLHEYDATVHLPKHITGFGVPNGPRPICHRPIPEAAVGPPYFYYENVACIPKGIWDTISRFLYEIEPEHLDSSPFCAAARKRGYIHNLPIENRFHLKPVPPLTIQDALPLTRNWWPSWDKRTKLDCLNTCSASAKLTQRLRDSLERWNDTPPSETQTEVLRECRKWNLVWTGKNKLAPLEPDEIELILGYPKDHTRGGGISRTDRYKSLGNSFQVDTVAYHLSVLKDIFPSGMNVLSLFSGIGGAEVALDRLGIPLNNVVSVEISQVNRNIIRSWWEQTQQKGNLIEFKDVQDLTTDKLKHLVDSLGGFDLVVGGSPCNNVTSNNRSSRDGLKGEHSVLFYDYVRVLRDVKVIMGTNV